MNEQERRERLNSVTADIEKYRLLVCNPISYDDPSTITHQLSLIHNGLQGAVYLKEKVNYLLISAYGEQAIKFRDKPLVVHAQKEMDREVIDYLFWYNLINGLINESHYQINILTSLLNHKK